MYEIYVVKDGDTLDSIAKEYGVMSLELKRINGIINDSLIIPGTQIIVPVEKKKPYQYYTAKKGDTMKQIAMDNDVDYSLLLQLNGLDDGDYIYPNQTIIIPKKGISLYMTKNDDTLEFVLNKLNISIEELLGENENIFLLPEQILTFREK